ncbi:MAG: outer membrane lipoprotein carrier protein LolA [Desulfomonilaceae bacterium]
MTLIFKRICKVCAPAIAMLPLLAACAVKAPAAPAQLDSLIDGIERKAYVVNQFHAKFVKTRHSAVFNRDLSVKGDIVFQKPNRFWLSMSGDVNVDILSDGRVIAVVHDHSDQELFHVDGDRDLSKFADPLVLIMQGIGDGALRRFAVVKNVREGNANVLDVEPDRDSNFEKIKDIKLSFSDFGEMNKVVVSFKNGDRDETVFRSWELLVRDDPEILKLNKRLKNIARRPAESSPKDPAGKVLAEMKDQNVPNLLHPGTAKE